MGCPDLLWDDHSRRRTRYWGFLLTNGEAEQPVEGEPGGGKVVGGRAISSSTGTAGQVGHGAHYPDWAVCGLTASSWQPYVSQAWAMPVSDIFLHRRHTHCSHTFSKKVWTKAQTSPRDARNASWAVACRRPNVGWAEKPFCFLENWFIASKDYDIRKVPLKVCSSVKWHRKNKPLSENIIPSHFEITL